MADAVKTLTEAVSGGMNNGLLRGAIRFLDRDGPTEMGQALSDWHDAINVALAAGAERRLGNLSNALWRDAEAELKEVFSISHSDFCRLSRAFNEAANLRDANDRRINEWLKAMISSAQLRSVEASALSEHRQ